MSSMDRQNVSQRDVLACGGCSGVGESDLKMPKIERLTDNIEQLSPSAHAMKILDLFSLDPAGLTKLQKNDRGLKVHLNESDKWIPDDVNIAQDSVTDNGYIFFREIDQGGRIETSAVYYRSLERSAVAFTNEITQEDDGACHYTASKTHPSPLMFISNSRFAVALSPSLTGEELQILLNESPIRRKLYEK